MARARTNLPELPGCTPMPLHYKEEPVVNGNDQPLALCDRCKGDGHVCTAEKKTFDNMGAATFETLKEFAGIYRRQRERGGWIVTSLTCSDCKGAGLLVEDGK